MNAAEFKADGFQMLQYLLSTVSNTTASSKMKAVSDLVALEQAPGEPSGLFMSRVRDIQEVVGSMQVAELLPLFALAHLDSSRYPGLMMRYVINDPAITGASTRSLEQEMLAEETRIRALSRNGQLPDLPPTVPAANRVNTARPTPLPPRSPPLP